MDNHVRSKSGRIVHAIFVSFNWLMPAVILVLWVTAMSGAMSETQCERSPFDLHRHSDICANVWPFILTAVGTVYLLLVWTLGAIVLGFLSFMSRSRDAGHRQPDRACAAFSAGRRSGA